MIIGEWVAEPGWLPKCETIGVPLYEEVEEEDSCDIWEERPSVRADPCRAFKGSTPPKNVE